MPEFNADGSLRIISDSYVWGDPLDYSSLTLAPLVSDQGQLKVIFTPTIMFTDALATDPFDPQEVLTEDQLEILTTLTNVVIDSDSKTITIPQPVSVDVGSYTVNGSPFTVAYFSLAVAVSPAQLLEVRRDTDVTTAVVDFQSGSRLTSEALNAANSQNLFAIQELTEFGAFVSGGSGGGGGGTFDGSLTDITGATQLAGTTGNVIWTGSELNATDNAQGVLPYTDSAPINAVLRVSSTATNVTGTVWEVLETPQIKAWDNVGIVSNDSLAFQLSGIETKTAPITNISNLWSVQAGAGKDITLDGRNINLIGDSSVDVTGDVNVGQIGDSFVLTLNGANVNNIISNAVLKTDDLDVLANVSSTTPDSGSYLQWNGSAWAPTGSLDVPSTTTLSYGGILVSSAVSRVVNSPNSIELINSDVALTGDTEVNSNFDTVNNRWTSDFEGRIRVDAATFYSKNANTTISTNANTKLSLFNSSGVQKSSTSSKTAYNDISASGINSNQRQITQAVFMDVEVGDYFEYTFTNSTGGTQVEVEYWNLTVQKQTFDSNLQLSSTSTPSMNFTGFLDNQDTSSDKEVFLTSAVEAQADGWSYTGSSVGFSGSSEFISNTTSGVFTAPRDMTLKVSYNFNWAGGNTSEDLSYQLSVDGVQWQSNKVHLKTSSVLTGVGNGDFSTLSGEWVVPLSQGQTLQLTQLAGGNTARVERLTYSVVEVLNEITANVVAQDALKVVTTDWSDRSNPLTPANVSLYEPTQVGLGADGRPIYEIYEEVTDSFVWPSSIQQYNYTAKASDILPSDVYNVAGAITKAVNADGSATSYISESAASLFGFFLSDFGLGLDNVVLSRGLDAPNAGGFVSSSSVVGFTVRYQVASDPLYQNYELVPVTP